jgi:hypothetical protein
MGANRFQVFRRRTHNRTASRWHTPLLLPLALAGGGSFTAASLNTHAKTTCRSYSSFYPSGSRCSRNPDSIASLSSANELGHCRTINGLCKLGELSASPM